MPEAGILYYYGNFNLVFQQVSEYSLASMSRPDVVAAREIVQTLKESRRQIQVKYIVKEVEDYLKTYSSSGMDINWRDNLIKQNGRTKESFELKYS
ncbi:hypothetical protein Tco_0752531 [Tanacetum coccineum]|uniref:Uncharacterized protein n=1 Tax=Tanacetum coccineum TaxID=301880 RepID=A0ABQ4ZAD0_9ASTR